MTKLLPSLALAVIATAGAVLPAAAETFGSFDESFQLIRLRDAGVTAKAANESVSGTMRVTVANADGSESWVTYNIDSLKPVGASYDNTATGSIGKANVYRSAPVVSLDSLTHDPDMVD